MAEKKKNSGRIRATVSEGVQGRKTQILDEYLQLCPIRRPWLDFYMAHHGLRTRYSFAAQKGRHRDDTNSKHQS
ncbi:MAG: hypothetical protein LBD20_05175 [Spirochaetaceae bacterium]|nr:hypothetical protein [Spirochaetaceae bacterium]